MGKAIVKFEIGSFKGKTEVFCDNEDSNKKILAQAKNLILKRYPAQEDKIKAVIKSDVKNNVLKNGFNLIFLARYLKPYFQSPGAAPCIVWLYWNRNQL